MEEARQQANPLAGELTRRDYASSEQDECIDDKSGNMESSAFPRGASPYIAESASNTKSGSEDGDPVIELSQLSGVLGSRKLTLTDSQISELNTSKEQSEKEPLLSPAKDNQLGYGSGVDSKAEGGDSGIKTLSSSETGETESDYWSSFKNCFASLFGSAVVQEVSMITVADRSFLEQNKGVQNTGVDCYLNSVLQCLKTVFLQCSTTQKENVIAQLTTKPYLVSFLRGTLDTKIEGNARALCKDIAALVANDIGLSAEDCANIDEEGSSLGQADPIDFLRVLLPHLDNSTMRQEITTRSCTMPGLKKAEAEDLASLIKDNRDIPLPGRADPTRPMLIELQNERKTKTAAEETIVDLHLSETVVNQKNLFPTLECDLDKDKPVSDMQSLIRARVVKENKAFFDESIEQILYKACYSTVEAQGKRAPDASDYYNDILVEEKIGNPPPSSLIITIKRLNADYGTEPPTREKIMMPLDRIWEPVVLPGDQEGRDVNYTYVPTSITCHLGSASGGHYVCYRKNGDDWFLFNDHAVGKINLDDRPYAKYSHKDLIM